MNIGILVPFMNNFGENGFYNSQEVGLAKSLINYTQGNIIIIKLNNKIKKKIVENIDGKITIINIPAYKIGSNGVIFKFSILKELNLKQVVMFSDIQIIVKNVYKYCKKNNIEFIPYIGTIDSASKNKLVRFFMKYFISRNIDVYKKNKYNLVKTPAVMKQLNNIGVKNLKLGSVGLDFDLLNNEYCKNDIKKIKLKLGYRENDKIILFVGRMETQKKPLIAIDILMKLIEDDKNYKLIMIGTGSLKSEVNKKIYMNNLKDYIRFIDKVENKFIWEYYLVSDYFINLNDQEIFGMAILEAMYYECKVIAVNAPGPNYIIENKKNGILIENLDIDEFVNAITNKLYIDMGRAAKEHIINNFSWNNVAKLISEN